MYLCLTGRLRDMLTGLSLPASTVIASNLYKSEWKEYAEVDLGLADIDDVGNGLLLWKPIEHAFDTSALCFIYDKDKDWYAHMLLLAISIGLYEVMYRIVSYFSGSSSLTFFHLSRS